MATIHHLPKPAEPDTLLARLAHLIKLEMELGLAEAREILVSVAIAVAVGVTAGIALIAALLVLLAGAFAPLFGAPWQHLVIVGGGALLLAAAGIWWSVHRLRALPWPRRTLESFEENWRWFAAQLRSRLTLR
jgi:hypothetical protein